MSTATPLVHSHRTHSLSAERAAPMLAALGSEVRLAVFRQLLRAGGEGVSVSGLQRQMGIPPSTLGHHLSALVGVCLVTQTRISRELLCRAAYGDIHALSAFLLRECCAGNDCPPAQTSDSNADEAQTQTPELV